MHKYLINNKEVTKTDWQTAFKANPEAVVILRTQYIPPTSPTIPINEPIISAEKAKLIRNKFKNHAS
jgi:hypothetical protein